MAGVKGRSGGARPGSGPKRKAPAQAMVGADPADPGKAQETYEKALGAIDKMDPLDFLEAVMRGQIDATALQVRSAIAAAQYRHKKLHDGGTKDAKQKKADDLAADPVSKFGVTHQPKRISNH